MCVVSLLFSIGKTKLIKSKSKGFALVNHNSPLFETTNVSFKHVQFQAVTN